MHAGKHPHWWGDYRIARGTTARWRIGPLTLWVQRLPGEWRMATEAGGDPLDSGLAFEQSVEVDDLAQRESTRRFALGQDSDRISLSARLADRAIVTRSEKPLSVPAGEEVQLFVSSPVWIRIEAGEPARFIDEMPIHRPSDTWFGPNSQHGELCYASTSSHRLRLEEVPIRPHRATTSVRVQNRAGSILSLDRLQVPVERLCLYVSKDGRLWTDDVIYTRREEDLASLAMRSREEDASGLAAVKIAEPRRAAGGHIALRAFSSIFG
ncbi:MAG: DUF432 domain-containing protein [Deltaproteobacteria bacterium]|nr:DUF432 domain-containing protein [Deltaproteobacteria bacterium]